MANFIGVVTADPAERRRCVSTSDSMLTPFPWLRTGSWEEGSVSIAWSAAPDAPVSSASRPDGWVSFVMGEILEPEATQQSPAMHALAAVAAGDPGGACGLGGYYAACVADRAGTVSIATDLLGLFPLYYAASANRLVFSTSPGLIKATLTSGAEPSPFGIAAILLTSQIVDGQTIWKGIRRLPAGSVLTWREGVGCTERPMRQLTPTDRHFGCSPAAGSELLGSALESAVRRAAADQPASVMLSGGLDSRLIAGFAHEVRGSAVTSLTFGRRGDFELWCASAVARHLGWRQVVRADDYSQYPRFARLQIDLEQMSTSFVDLAWWAGIEAFREVGGPVLTGFLGDAVMGGSHIDWAMDPRTGRYGFDPLFKMINRSGIRVDKASALLRKDFFGDAVAEVVEALRSSYEAIPGESFQKGWVFDLLNRQRFHVAPFAWRMAFGAWPKLPYADRSLVEAAAGLPLNALRDRAAQKLLLKSRFDALARLPLDTNSTAPTPLTSDAWSTLRGKVYASRFADRFVFRWAERRYYYRVFDPTNPGWSSIRAMAEPNRTTISDMFETQALQAFLPPARDPLRFDDPILEGCGIKALLGLILASGKPGEHPAP